MPTDITLLLQRVPAWRDRTDITTTFLSGGITNQNYRVDVGAESFVLRIGGAKTELLGIDRANEAAATRAAAEIGVAPEVLDFVQPEGYLVTRFINARAMPPAEMREPETLQEIAHLLKKIHVLPPLRATFSPFKVVRDYDLLAREHGVTTFPENYAWLRERMTEIERALVSGSTRVFCHNDLLNGNFLRDSQDRIRILDWEYAGMGDPFFDLANFSAHHELTDEQCSDLLTAYLDELKPHQFARLKLMQAMSDFREAMWGVLQQGISELDFDFRGYADQFFGKLTARMDDARYAEWVRMLDERRTTNDDLR